MPYIWSADCLTCGKYKPCTDHHKCRSLYLSCYGRLFLVTSVNTSNSLVFSKFSMFLFFPLKCASSSVHRTSSFEPTRWLFPCSLLFPAIWLCLLGFSVGLRREMKVLIITAELKIASNSLAWDTKIDSLPAYSVKYSGNPSKVTSVKTSFWVYISFFFSQNISLVSA